MNRSTLTLLFATVTSAFAAACESEAPSLMPQPFDPTMPGSGSAASDAGSGAVAPAADGGLSPQATPPGGGTGARHYFVDHVYKSLNDTCGPCHGEAQVGPRFFYADAAKSYDTLDARGAIVDGSPLVTKGAHEGPRLTDEQMQIVMQWLALEAQERAGKGPATSVLDKFGTCFLRELFDAIPWADLRTQPRDGEDPDTCNACKQRQCAACHNVGDYGFYMNVTNGPDPVTFQMTQTMPFIAKYIALDGAKPIPSNAIALKAQHEQANPAYSPHPMFTLSNEMKVALDNFVQAATHAYEQGGCGK